MAHLLRLGLAIFLPILYLRRGLILNINEIFVEWQLLDCAGRKIFITFIFDFISIFFIIVVSLISRSVFIFRVSYMLGEGFYNRFFLIVVSFIFSIFLLILRPNLVRILLGWDGLGVTSYLLVVFYQRNKSYNAGIITAITNRLGDVGILLCIALIIFKGHWLFSSIDSDMHLSEKIFMLILILAACTKRAQIPFSAWLPAAIAAPTPVSALVHSSTLVTAGVYLLIRFNFILANSSYSTVLIIIGIVTILIAGATALYEIDIKKVIALSTLRQLGVIITILGLNSPILAYFHLLSHAYFKAMLFICAGIVIHNMKDYQDIRKISLMLHNIPLVYRIIIVANIRLCGLPFLRGFYSKDLILEVIIIKNLGIFIFRVILLATFLTVAYSCRIIFLLSSNFSKSESFFIITDNDKFIVTGIIYLLLFSIIGGIALRWDIIYISYYIFIPLWTKSIIISLILSASVFGFFVGNNKGSIFQSKKIIFLRNIWFMPLLFSIRRLKVNLFNSKLNIKASEGRWIEIVIFQKNYYALKKFSKYFNLLFRNYLLGSGFLILVLVFLY